MAYGLKYFFTDKKLVGSSDPAYVFEIYEDGYSGSSTEWRGVQISRNYDQLSYRRLNFIQKSSCQGTILVEDATQRGVIEAIAGSEQGDFLVKLKRNGVLLWTGLVVPELTVIGEENYGNQNANIVAKDIFLSGDFPLATEASGDTEKAIVIIADILDTLGYGLNIVTFTSWTDNTVTQSDDILNQAYHELERFRVYSTNATEEPRALSNEQALNYMLKAYGLILRQVDGEWNLLQISAFKDLTSVGSWAYTSAGVQYAGSRGQNITASGTVSPSDDLYVLGGTSNNFFAGVKSVTSRFQHESTIQGIKFNPEYWITDGATLTESQFWQADGTGNLELSFVLWFAKTTSVDLGNPNVLDVRIFIDTGGATDYYWNGSSWTTSVSNITIDVEETFSTTDSDGNYVHKGEPFSIVTDPIPDLADGTLTIEFDPDELQTNYAYWYLRDLRFHLTYDDEIDGTSFAIDFELTQTGSYSDVYEYGVYHFGEGPTSASLSAIKDSTGDLLASWKRYGDASTIPHQQLLLNEILHVRRTPKRNMRANLYGEYEPDNILVYDSSNFFFLGGSWNSKSYEWNCNFSDINYSEASDTLNTFYLTDGAGTSSGAVGSSGSSGTSSPINALLRANNLSDLTSDSSARTNLGVEIGTNVQAHSANLDAINQDLGTSDSPSFAGATLNGQLTSADIVPATDDTEFLGGTSTRWRVLYATRIRTDILREADGSNVLGMTSTTRDLYGTDGNIKISFETDIDLSADITSTGSATFGDGTTDEEVKVYESGGAYASYQGDGVSFNRATSYLIPTLNITKELVIGYNDAVVANARRWNSIKADSTEYRLFVEGDEVIFIDSTKDVGIGNTSQNAKLHITKSTSDLLRLERADGNGTDIDLVFSGGNFGVNGADKQYAKITCARASTLNTLEKSSLEFYIKNDGTDIVAMTLDDQGSLLFGTINNATNSVIKISTDANGLNNTYGITIEDDSANTGYILFTNSAGTVVGSITRSGSSTVYATTSDYRIKENVVEMTGALDRVDQLKPSRFNFINDPDTTVDGFLAHEVENIIPEAITGEKDAVDDEGNPIYQGIDQSKIVPLLVGAIKELKAEIEELKARIDS